MSNTVESSKTLSHWMNAVGFLLGVKWLRHEADCSPPSGTNKNEWSYVYTPTYAFKVWAARTSTLL